MADKPIVFGFATYKGAVAGLRLQSVTYGETCSSAEAPDEDGNTFLIDSVTVRESVNAHKTCSISGSAPIPASE